MAISLIRCILFIGFVFTSQSAFSKVQNETRCQTVKPTHDVWGQLLKQYVRNGQVDYIAWHKNNDDRKALSRYVKSLSELCEAEFKSLDKPAQLALLLNLYNAAVIELVLRYFPIKSINDIQVDSKGAFDFNWLQARWSGSQAISLNHLENNLIRPWFKDARIHFALVCAAKSCPALLAEPYRGDSVSRQLNTQTREFFEDKRQVFYRQQDNTIVVSKIFNWYQIDFVNDAGTLKAYIIRETREATGQDIASNVKIAFHDYSWDLNQAP